MPPPPAGRAPHITLPSKNVIANQSADRRGNPYTPRTALPVPRRGRRLPTVVPADSRPLSWPPIGALPRNRLASPATGGASPISPTTRRQRTASPQKSCHCKERSDVAIRTPTHRTPSPCVGAGFYPARPLLPIPIKNRQRRKSHRCRFPFVFIFRLRRTPFPAPASGRR